MGQFMNFPQWFFIWFKFIIELFPEERLTRTVFCIFLYVPNTLVVVVLSCCEYYLTWSMQFIFFSGMYYVCSILFGCLWRCRKAILSVTCRFILCSEEMILILYTLSLKWGSVSTKKKSQWTTASHKTITLKAILLRFIQLCIITRTHNGSILRVLIQVMFDSLLFRYLPWKNIIKRSQSLNFDHKVQILAISSSEISLNKI